MYAVFAIVLVAADMFAVVWVGIAYRALHFQYLDPRANADAVMRQSYRAFLVILLIFEREPTSVRKVFPSQPTGGIEESVSLFELLLTVILGLKVAHRSTKRLKRFA